MISLFLGGTKDRTPAPGPTTVDEVLGLLQYAHPDGLPKDAYPAWSPAVYPSGARRGKAHVSHVTCLVADVDDGTPPEVATQGLPPCRMLLHTSYSHTEAYPKYRIVVPLAHPIPAEHYPAAWAWLADRVPCLDRACADASRLYYVPVARPGAWTRLVDGPLLDVDWAALPPVSERTPARPPPTWAPTPERPQWAPRPEDYAPTTVARAVATWRERLAADVAILPTDGGRRTAIRAIAFHAARYTWLDEALIGELRTTLENAADAIHRLDDNIRILLEDCVRDATADPGAIEDLVPASEPGVALPFIVKRGPSVWVLRPDGRTYEGPGDTTDALGWLKERGDVRIATAKGRSVPFPDLFRAHGVTAREVTYAFPRPDGTLARPWDPAGRTLAVSVAHAPLVTPCRVPEVATWLGLALSETTDEIREAVLDWLVTAWGPALDQPSSCLYLQGPPGSGKSILALAIASPWRCAPVPMKVALQQFNEAALRCPVLWVDEGAKAGAVDSDQFRETIGARDHRVEIKRGAVVALRSAIRGIISANNATAIAFPAIPSLADLDAIAERILHVWWSEAAMKYLRRRGDNATRGWVTAPDGGPGLIAQHIAWLATTRRVTPGSRWVVPGIRAAYHDGLVLQAPLSSSLLAGALAGATSGAFPVVDDTVQVSAVNLRNWWVNLTRDDARPPTLHALTNALDAVSRTGGAGTWSVEGRLVRVYAERMGMDVPGVLTVDGT